MRDNNIYTIKLEPLIMNTRKEMHIMRWKESRLDYQSIYLQLNLPHVGEHFFLKKTFVKKAILQV